MSARLTPEEIAVFRATALRHRAERLVATAGRRARALQLAQEAATLLRERFGATRVVLFGSLLRPYSFTEWSDVDIAAWGIAPEDTFHAIGDLYDMDPGIKVDLVDMNYCKLHIRTSIERDGVEL